MARTQPKAPKPKPPGPAWQDAREPYPTDTGSRFPPRVCTCGNHWCAFHNFNEFLKACRECIDDGLIELPSSSPDELRELLAPGPRISPTSADAQAAGLDAHERDVFCRRYINGHVQTQIAAALGRSQSDVCRVLKSIRGKFQRVGKPLPRLRKS